MTDAMSPHSRIVCLLYALIVFIMLLMPPWEIERDIYGDGISQPATVTEYRPIFSSSSGKLSRWEYDYGGKYTGRINKSLLLIQLLVVSIVSYIIHEKLKVEE